MTAAVVVAVLASVNASGASGTSCEQALFNVGQNVGAPSQITGPAPSSLSSRFAVLRRAQTQSDLLPPFRQVDFYLASELGSYYVDAIRQFAPGQYLVIGHDPYFPVLPARCLPKRERAKRGRLVAQEKARAATLIDCVATLSAETCWPASDLDSEADTAQQELHGDQVRELVPDGVASVALSYRNGERQTVAVSNNILQFSPPAALLRPVRAVEEQIDAILVTRFASGGRPLSRSQRHALAAEQRHERRAERQLVPAAVTWLDAGGATVRTVHPPLVPAPAKLLPDSAVKLVGPTSPTCPTGSSTSCPEALAGPGPASLLSELAVLRRAQSPADVLPAISEISTLLPMSLGTYYPAATRLLAPGLYLVVGNLQLAPAGSESGASVTETFGSPASLRNQTAQSAPLTYCLTTLIQPNCQPTSNLDSEADLAIELAQGGGTASELVPDAVASVTVQYRDGTAQTATVANNLFQFAPPAAAQATVSADSWTLNNLDTVLLNHPSAAVARRTRAALAQAETRYTEALKRVVPANIVWRDASGAILETLHPPLTDDSGASVSPPRPACGPLSVHAAGPAPCPINPSTIVRHAGNKRRGGHHAGRFRARGVRHGRIVAVAPGG